MPGMIVRVAVQVGDAVQAGQGLVVMEAMKMENELRATAAGTVKAVLATAGHRGREGRRPPGARMMRRVILAATRCAARCAARRPAQAQAPNPDIFLAPTHARAATRSSSGRAANITHRAGYDNQPSFTPDGRALLYTGIGADGQADIWRYDIARAAHVARHAYARERVFGDADAGGRRFSAMRVERDSTQRLWSFALDGSDPKLLLASIKPVGYHAWLGARRLAHYVLGHPRHAAPRERRRQRRRGSRARHRPRDPARAGRNWVRYTQREGARELWITAQPVEGGPPSELVRAPADNEYHAWTPDGALLSATEGAIVQWNRLTDDDERVVAGRRCARGEEHQPARREPGWQVAGVRGGAGRAVDAVSDVRHHPVRGGSMERGGGRLTALYGRIA